VENTTSHRSSRSGSGACSRGAHARFPDTHPINPDINPKFTVVDIAAPDRLGLLYDILRAVSDAKSSSPRRASTTEKGAAIDSFYITDLEAVR